jgi:hypothetical protein
MTQEQAAHDRGDEQVLDDLVADAATLLDVPAGELATRAQALVRRIVTSRRSDDTWPPAELLHEALRVALDVFDERLRTDGRHDHDHDLGADPTWLTAWRECAQSPAAFRSLLDQFRSEDSPAGFAKPPEPRADELSLLIEP